MTSTPKSSPAADEILSRAYFALEPDIRDLRHMAAITWTLFDGTIKSPESGSGWLTLQISTDEFEQLEFAISRTRHMASDLDKVYLKKFEEAGAARALEREAAAA
jgi:hypothetical protein